MLGQLDLIQVVMSACYAAGSSTDSVGPLVLVWPLCYVVLREVGCLSGVAFLTRILFLLVLEGHWPRHQHCSGVECLMIRMAEKDENHLTFPDSTAFQDSSSGWS